MGRRTPIALLIATLVAAGCSRSTPADEPAAPPAAATSAAHSGLAGKLKQVVEALAHAGSVGNWDGCRENLSSRTRAWFEGLFRAAGLEGNDGWATVCRAHASLSWPEGAAVRVSEGKAVVSAPDTHIHVTFVREEGRWRVDYATSPDAPALDAIRLELRGD